MKFKSILVGALLVGLSQPAFAEQVNCTLLAKHFSIIFSLKNKGVPLEKVQKIITKHKMQEYAHVYENIYDIKYYVSEDTAYSKIYKNCLKNEKIVVM